MVPSDPVLQNGGTSGLVSASHGSIKPPDTDHLPDRRDRGLVHPLLPTPALVVDGHVGDLTHRVADQAVTTGFGDGINQFDALCVDADEHRLAVGIEGLLEWERNAIVLLIDVDYGAGSGIASLEAHCRTRTVASTPSCLRSPFARRRPTASAPTPRSRSGAGPCSAMRT